MSWAVQFLPEAERDMNGLSRPQQAMVRKAIEKVRENPLPQSEGGYGKPLGHKRGFDLTNLMKIKLRGAGLRVVYKLIRTETQMLVIVVGVREDEEVYALAHARRTKNHL
ncbi:MAG: type II toxin-antitoxin system RelE/ParE family toxin [Clostridia bacterium]|nr:type II toxin-antitoxin system RelE/ParE family toxin [Clostridia bacterium]